MSASPKESDVRKLFGKSMNRCAFENCPNHIIEPTTGVIVGQICHINAKSPKGPRYLSSQTDEERHGNDNLLLLCRTHHAVIDHKQNELKYSGDFLRALKARHEVVSVGAIREPQITNDQIEKLIRTSVVYEPYATHNNFSGAVFNVGGQGGQYGGAGGGGGVLNVYGTSVLPDGLSLNLDGRAGQAPGGGGGGAGSIKFTGRDVELGDIANGLRISSMLLANSAEVSGNLLSLNAGAWSCGPLPSIPVEQNFVLIFVVELGALAPTSLIRIDVVLTSPSGAIASTKQVDVAVPERPGLTERSVQLQCFPVRIAEIGKWAFTARSGGHILAVHEIEIRLDDQ